MTDLTFVRLTMHTEPIARLELLLAHDSAALRTRDRVLDLARKTGVLGLVRGPSPTGGSPALVRVEVIDVLERLEVLRRHLQPEERQDDDMGASEVLFSGWGKASRS